VTCVTCADPAEVIAPPEQVRRLQRRLARETAARKEAERLLEQKSLELFALNRSLMQLNNHLEQRVEHRTRELMQERLQAQEQAYRDPLTGLANRPMFRRHLRQAVRRAGCLSHAAVLYLDLSGFKTVNDTLGHPVGDALLCAAAARLRHCTQPGDLVARIGGDEFVVVQIGPAQPEAAAALSKQLLRAIQAPFSVQSHRIAMNASIGIATAPAASADADVLLRDADIALRVAQAEGRGTTRLFRPEMHRQVQDRQHREGELRHAVEQQQFELFYQPLLQAGTGHLAGFEALLRWRHPERGHVPPAEFIPLAEETALIRPLGAWVLEQACREAARWPGSLKVAVNLSPVQFVQGELLDGLRHALDASGLDAARLELEITESVLLRNSDETLLLLRQMQALGVQISMDDFGTGYSSLSYLRSFPFNKIKIDRAFVRTLADGKGSLEIIRAAVGLGRALNMKVLAEGVETPAELATLRAEGCDEVQGFLFSRPVPSAEACRLIARDQDGRAPWRRNDALQEACS